MEKVLVTAGQFAGVVGELINGSVVIEIFGRECNIGCPDYERYAHDRPAALLVAYEGEQFAHLSTDIDKMIVE